MSEFFIDRESPLVSLDIQGAFKELGENEKLYAHYLSRASFYGGLIVLLQTSRESPQIYRLITRINRLTSLESLVEAAKEKGISDEDLEAYFCYCSGIYTYMGNYRGFGDTKIIPEISKDKFELLMKASAAYKEDPSGMDAIWASIKDLMYDLSEPKKQLGYNKKGINKYLSKNLSTEDAELVADFVKQHELEVYNTRLIKSQDGGKNVFEIRHAAMESAVLKEVEDFRGSKFVVSAGDYAELLGRVHENLAEAAKYAANDNERHMLEHYMKSFKTGSMDSHKDGSRAWIKNKGPVIETYIGFIENYRDPLGMRAEFEGFVAVVNKEQSQKFQELVNQATKLIAQLPWPVGFEKDTFLKPDFTSLDILTFSGSGIPIGINIPNYDDIRQNEGFKNVNLGNVISSRHKSVKPTSFVTQEDDKIVKKFVTPALEVQVGLHELLGHGSGKLLMRNADGSLNFASDLVDPLTGKAVAKHYEPGESYDSKFQSLGSAFEECRAECVGLYLCCDKEVLNIFGVRDEPDVVYVNWLTMCVSGLKSLEMYAPGAKEWKQAHSQGRFAILRVLLETGEGFLSVKEVTGEDGKPDFLIKMDRSKLESVGKTAIGDFLRKLQIFKSTGDAEASIKLFDHYSSVNNEGPFPWAKWRDIVVARRKPRMFNIMANTLIKDEKLSIVEYEQSKSGLIQSWVERFSPKEHEFNDEVLLKLYEKDLPDFD
eukprot:TRINITY_DN3009_c0_g1_i1.p1 TRINITY_DN3009_c0_g1~~TRINITY_DN3009_c0_g1_i1.p1  ORF type:complete len:809 (-),score=242.44 TRINITY_DN3009_c0_g1_i1:90-2228(-)